jgi:glyoxylase-like metal-dependent hydrolase (beta-lactamase superfamily II)/rhodanese-related sulfurtransferase
MYFQQFLNLQHGCASYLIASHLSREAAIVDPAIETEQYEAVLRQRDLRLRYVIDTHIHADHVSGARALAAEHGAELCLHESARAAYDYRPLHDGEELALDQLRLRVCHTPGHRPELVSLLIINLQRSSEPAMVLTADTLLAGSVGRPDFNGGDAEAQFVSLRRLLDLPDWVAVFPGHFEGACGSDLTGQPITTIGFERQFNPLARLDRSAFVSALSRGVPARPLNMTAIEATNRGLADMAWAMLRTAPPVSDVDVAGLEARPADAITLDLREPAEYAHGHVPGAVNLPQADLASRLEEVPRDRPVFLVCESGNRSRQAARFLAQMGFDQVMNVNGGTAEWRAAGKPVTSDTGGPEASRSDRHKKQHAGA